MLVDEAVRTLPCVVVPVMVGKPVGASLTLAMAAVESLTTRSWVPKLSVKVATTLTRLPTCAWVVVKVEADAPSILDQSVAGPFLACHW